MANKSTTAKRKSTASSTGKKSTATKKQSSTKKNTTKSTGTKAKTKNVTVEAEVIDVAKVEAIKEVFLWLFLAVCVLLFLSNLGIGGVVGNAVSGFFFGLLGLLAYFFPILLLVATFFGISNHGNHVATIKLIAGGVATAFLSVLMELFAHGGTPYAAMRAFYYGRENKVGGGWLGGLIATGLVKGFGLVGAYVITLVIMIVCVVLITERTLLHRTGAKHRNKRRYTDPNESREERLARIRADKKRQQDAAEADETTPRRNRKISGVAFDTQMESPMPVAEALSDELEEVRMAPQQDVEVKNVKRVPLSSKRMGSASVIAQDENCTKKPSSTAAMLTSDEPLEHSTVTEEKLEQRMTTEEKPQRVARRINVSNPSVASAATVEESRPQPVVTQPVVTQPVVTTQTEEPIPEDMPVNEPERRPRKTAASMQETQKSADEVAASIAKSKSEKKPNAAYKFPLLSLLKKKAATGNGNSKAELEKTADKLEQTLRNFGINVEVTDVTCGPTVTRYELQPEVGVRVNRITNLADDIKLNLAVTDIRIEAPIPGKAAVGIEVPNKDKVMVSFEELASSKEFKGCESKVTFCAGRDIAGNVITANIAKMPHLLIAGTTGSGKSVCINTIIMSILYKARPDEVKFIMIDPKVVELSIYNGIPHLLIPVVTDPKKAAGALHWAVTEMDDRYQKFADASVRDIKSYNKKLEEHDYKLPINSNGELATFEKMPEMVVIVDELADLMMVAAKEVEESICRLAQKARAAGIYLILATQRPSVDVVTGLIKANMPSRIAFAVNSGVDSRTILDMFGAEKLLGNGDMLYYPQGYTKPLRVQGAFVSDEEVQDVVDYIKGNNDEANYDERVTNHIESGTDGTEGATAIGGGSGFEDTRDAYFAEAGRLIVSKEKGSIGMLQRNFKIGFNRAARIMDQLEEAGVVGPEMGTKPRTVHMTQIQFEQLLNPAANISAVEEEYPVSDDF